jgi:biotin synthase
MIQTSILTEESAALDLIKAVEGKALSDEPLTLDEATAIMRLDNAHIFDLIAVANRVRRKHKGDEISLCSIINARSGGCGEDCAFCPQSAGAQSVIPEYGMVTPSAVVDCAKNAIKAGAHKFGVVTSGYGFTGNERDADFDTVLESIREMKEKVNVHRCASLGVIDEKAALALKAAGLEEYHHNLETARSFIHNIRTTHSYDEDVNAVKAAKSAGMRVCCGGIFGIGESPEQRVELAFTLKELDVDSAPLNFLNPVKGTRLENMGPLAPFEILKIIAVYRMILPTKDIKVAGGREKNLRDLQCLMFAAGANSTMAGNYLTTEGRSAEDDLAMIRDLGLTVIGR